MNVIVQSKTLPITQALRSYVEQQTHKLEKYANQVGDIYVFLEHAVGKKSQPYSAKVKYLVTMPGRPAVVVRRKAADLYSGIVDATDRTVRLVRKAKEKRLTQQRRGQLAFAG